LTSSRAPPHYTHGGHSYSTLSCPISCSHAWEDAKNGCHPHQIHSMHKTEMHRLTCQKILFITHVFTTPNLVTITIQVLCNIWVQFISTRLHRSFQSNTLKLTQHSGSVHNNYSKQEKRGIAQVTVTGYTSCACF
jgi:hypothetical protein